MTSIPLTAPADAHEWVSFEDTTEERTWVFDVTFLLSSWECIFGSGCQGVLTGPAEEMVQGCCSYGAHFIDDEDASKIEELAKDLTADEWQFKAKGKKGVIRTNKHGEIVTKQADDACIFLNRPGFAAGPGCALHLAALNRSERPLDWKPTVCWQLPLRREDDDSDESGHVTSTIRQWDRKHWGDGGAEFHWWCTESPDAFVGKTRVYESMRDEIVEMVGQGVYLRLVSYLEERTSSAPLPHPAVRLTKKPQRA